MDNVNFLLSRIQNKSALIGIAGLGYVGLPLAVEFARAGFAVLGVDLSSERVEMLKHGQSYVLDVSSEEIGRVMKSGNITLSTSYGIFKEADAIIICVPTPLRKTKDPDITYIREAVTEVKKVIHFPILIVLESTTYPGTTRELIVNEIESMSYQVGKDFFVAFSPERVDPGNQIFQTKNIPKVVGGITLQCTELARALYDHVIEKVIAVKSAEEAEMVKLLENTFRSVNIALVNEMADVSRVLFPADWNTSLASIKAAYQSQGQIWTLVTPKSPVPEVFTREQSEQLVNDGAIAVRRQADGQVILAAIGGYQLAEAMTASDRLTERGVGNDVIYIIEPARFRSPRDAIEAQILLAPQAREQFFPGNVMARVFACHTRPESIAGVLRTLDTGPDHARFLGFCARGGMLDTFGTLFVNRCTWAHIVAAAAEVTGRRPEDLLTQEELIAVRGQGDPSVLRER